MTLIILVSVFLFLAFFLLFLFMLPRYSAERVLLEQVTQPASAPRLSSAPSRLRAALNIDALAKPFTFFRSFFSSAPDPELVHRLSLAGYRNPAHADMLLGARLALPAILGVTAAFVFTQSPVIFFLLAVAVGFFIPDFWLSYAINSRREKIRLSLPDGLDLLSICMEAGLGLDQGIVRTGNELRMSHRELSEELLHINFEQRAGVARIAAWKSFAERTDVESVRSFVAMLVQTDRFGTPLSKSLANFSDALRVQRRQKAEERAAKATIKLVPPLVFFIFPNIAVVTVGPAIITVAKNLEEFLK
jgi:tight adherence protein C